MSTLLLTEVGEMDSLALIFVKEIPVALIMLFILLPMKLSHLLLL